MTGKLTDVLTRKKYRIGVALSGGGIKGLCHAGVLKALDEYGVRIDIISGVSAGAIVGAMYADGYTPDEIAALFEDMSFRQMTKLQIPDGGIFRIDSFERFLKKHLRAKTFEELKIPLRMVATDLDKGESVVFMHGELIPPIIASSSVPILFSPKIINGVHYVDGGVLKNFPVSTIRDECQTVIGINASPLVAREYKPSLMNVASRTYHFMFKSNILHDKEICDLLIEPVEMGNYETFGVEKSREIFELGYKEAKKILKKCEREQQITVESEAFEKLFSR
ncbi:MAG: patatin-like phospholipase family protein [Prevotellaceae bacterium]|jgi:NTE family protein|nr:patatin-like phospholipase family protein [Prevotellaceae bacterium]